MAWVLGIATVAGGIAALIYFWEKCGAGSKRTERTRQRHKDQLAAFLTEGQHLTSRLDEHPLPIAEHNAWVDRVAKYLRENLGKAHEVRFGDFSGMVFYGDGSKRSDMSRSLEGRSRRLHEFMSELGA